MSYLLDTNTLITAKNDFYAFDVFPCFWSWLEHETLSGTCVLLDVVVDEIRTGGDDLTNWVQNHVPQERIQRAREDFQVFTCYRTIAEMVYNDAVFSEQEKEKFLSVADPWLIATGKVWGDTVVTFEKHPGVGAKRVKIPAIAQRMNVRVMNLYQMMRELHANFE